MCHKSRNHPWGSKSSFAPPFSNLLIPLNVFCLIVLLLQVQYTAWKDQEGNYVSADTEERLNEHQQVTIPEEKVIKSGDHFVLKEDPSIRLIPRVYKMSKSRGNVVNPDDVVLEYGADSLRLYEMFMGPFRDSKTWNTSGIEGVHRFLARTWRLVIGLPQSDGSFKDGTLVTDDEPTLEQLRTLHKCIAKVISSPYDLFAVCLHLT
jgi:leucyl-tRNA synthetase